MLKTVGIHPKVAVPSIALFGLGAALVVAGLVFGDDSLKEVGGTAIAASGIAFGTGYAANPSDVEIAKTVEGEID